MYIDTRIFNFFKIDIKRYFGNALYYNLDHTQSYKSLEFIGFSVYWFIVKINRLILFFCLIYLDGFGACFPILYFYLLYRLVTCPYKTLKKVSTISISQFICIQTRNKYVDFLSRDRSTHKGVCSNQCQNQMGRNLKSIVFARRLYS